MIQRISILKSCFFIVLMLLVSSTLKASSLTDQLSETTKANRTAQSEEKHVVMLLWRGFTEAEHGFMDYLSRRINVRFTPLNANSDRSTLQAHIDALEKLQPDLIYSFGTTITLELLGTTRQPTPFRQKKAIPAVFSIVSDPVGSKIVTSLEPAERDFTGVSHIVPHDVQLTAISKLEDIKTLGIIFNPLESNSVVTARDIQKRSSAFNKDVYLYPLRTRHQEPDLNSIDSIIDMMVKDKIELAYLPPDSFLISQGGTIIEKLHQKSIKTFSATETPLRKHNAFFGIVSRYYNVGQFAAYKAEQILSGEKTPGQIPIEPLTQYSYIVNVSAAKMLDYYPPVQILKISELIGNSE